MGAYAQPGSFTDLGDHSTSASTFTQDVTLLASTDVQWFKVVLPNASDGSGGYVDMWTSTGGSLPMTDTEMGIYDDFGNMIANDDDDDTGLFSALSFGTSTPARPANGTGVAFNGRDGNFFSGGTYWIAVGNFNVTFNATAWDATSTYTGANRTCVLNLRIQPDGSPVPPSGTGAATPNAVQAGFNSLLTVTVTPGNNPPSTGIAVSADLSSLGGSSTQAFYDDGTNGDQFPGDNVYSYDFTTDVNAAFGAYSLPFTVSDAESRSTSGNIALQIIAPPPANDDCSTAEVVSEGSFAFDSTQATSDGVSDCAFSSSADVWYKYIPTSDGVATFATCGSSFDSVISLWDACGGTMLACNDDFCGLQSTIENYPVTNGVEVYVRVARYGSGLGGGPGSLSITNTPPPPPPSWDEYANGGGDCGDLPSSAQVPSDTGTGSLSSIVGSIDFSGDADMYRINICDPSTFSASAVNSITTGDTQMFLFDANGYGVAMDDDDPTGAGGLKSRLSNAYVFSPGTYFLAISSYDTDPLDELGQQIWLDTPFNVERAPDDVGAFNPVASWGGSASSTFPYRIDLTGACFDTGGGGCLVTCDYNQDGGADTSDVIDLANDIASGTESFGTCADYNQDGGADTSDVIDLANDIASGTCAG